MIYEIQIIERLKKKELVICKKQYTLIDYQELPKWRV